MILTVRSNPGPRLGEKCLSSFCASSCDGKLASLQAATIDAGLVTFEFVCEVTPAATALLTV